MARTKDQPKKKNQPAVNEFDMDRYIKNKEIFLVDIRRHLKRLGAFESIDKHVLNRMADWHSRYLELAHLVDLHGSVQIAQTGFTTKNAYYLAMIDAEKMLQVLYTKFGIDMITRDKLKLETKKKAKDDGLIK